MLFSKKRIERSQLGERILHCFPARLVSDVKRVTEILPTGLEIFSNAAQPPTISNLISPGEQILSLDDEPLRIPARVYFDEPNPEKQKKLTMLQKTILDCLYTRHHDGFVRQRRLMQLIDKPAYFVIPFTLQLLGEYVLEIIEDLQQHITPENMGKYMKFVQENPAYWIKTQHRVTSYWNAYYRHPQYPGYANPKYGSRKEYIGRLIVDRLNNAIRNSIK